MRNVLSEIITVKSTYNILELGKSLWSGAKDRWDEASGETKIAVWDRVLELVESTDVPTITQINDLIWFECDDLFYPSHFVVEAYKYENGTVGNKICELTCEFQNRDDAIRYAENLNADDRRVVVTDNSNGDVIGDW